MSDIVERLRLLGQDTVGNYGMPIATEAADEIERLRAALQKANEQTEHFERQWYLRGDELDSLRAERDAAEDALRRHGYRKSCDIPACNCGDQWNHGGHAATRLREISEELCDLQNGTLLDKVKALRAERDALKADAERYRWLRDKSPITWALYVEDLRCWKHDYDASIDAARKA